VQKNNIRVNIDVVGIIMIVLLEKHQIKRLSMIRKRSKWVLKSG